MGSSSQGDLFTESHRRKLSEYLPLRVTPHDWRRLCSLRKGEEGCPRQGSQEIYGTRKRKAGESRQPFTYGMRSEKSGLGCDQLGDLNGTEGGPQNLEYVQLVDFPLPDQLQETAGVPR